MPSNTSTANDSANLTIAPVKSTKPRKKRGPGIYRSENSIPFDQLTEAQQQSAIASLTTYWPHLEKERFTFNAETLQMEMVVLNREAAFWLDMTPRQLSQRTYKDKQLLKQGKPIKGPKWVESGRWTPVLYKISDIAEFLESKNRPLPDFTQRPAA